MARKDVAKKCQEIEYVSLKNDLLFHMVFTRNGRALKGLLSTLLNLPEPDILSVEILNPMQYSDVIDSRLTVLDIKVHLNGDTFVLVEIQVRRFGHWTKAYYPVNDEKNQRLYEKYKALADKEKNVIFGGRLGEYKYYDMDQVIAAALIKAKEILS